MNVLADSYLTMSLEEGDGSKTEDSLGVFSPRLSVHQLGVLCFCHLDF